MVGVNWISTRLVYWISTSFLLWNTSVECLEYFPGLKDFLAFSMNFLAFSFGLSDSQASSNTQRKIFKSRDRFRAIWLNHIQDSLRNVFE